MTIELTQAWSGHAKGARLSLTEREERSLVNGQAARYVAGASPITKPAPEATTKRGRKKADEASKPKPSTEAEEKAKLALAIVELGGDPPHPDEPLAAFEAAHRALMGARNAARLKD